MDAVSPDALAKRTPNVSSSQYAANWNAVHDSETVIPVEDTTTRRFGFNFVSSTLEVNSFQLGQLVKHATNTSDEEGRRLQPEEFNVVPLLAHELSHARDVLDGWTSNEAGGIDAKAQAVIDTELRAWAREALSAVQVWASSGHASEKPPQDDIVEGWLGYQPEMLDAAWSHRKTNGLMFRLIDYVSKNAGASDVETINAWISGRKAWLSERLDARAGAIHTAYEQARPK